MADVEMKIASVGRKKGTKRRSSKSPSSKRRLVFKSPAMQKGSNVERKWLDVHAQTQTFSTAGNFVTVNGMTKGTDIYQRIGRRVKMTSFHIRGWVLQNQNGAAASADQLRMLVVYDREPNGSVPGIAEILQDTNNAGSTFTDSTSHMNLVNSDRFAILKDFTWAVVQANASANQPAQALGDYSTNITIKYNKKLNLDVKYNSGNAGTIADITTGALYVVTIGTQVAANEQYELFWSSRIRFTDS